MIMVHRHRRLLLGQSALRSCRMPRAEEGVDAVRPRQGSGAAPSNKTSEDTGQGVVDGYMLCWV